MSTKLALRLFVAFTSVAANAAIDSGDISLSTRDRSSNLLGSVAVKQTGQSYLADQWYTLSQATVLNPIEVIAQNGTIDQSLKGRSLVLDAGIDYLVVSEKDGLATIAFNLEGQDDPQNPLPLEMTVQVSELGRGQATLVAMNADGDLADGSSDDNLDVASDDAELDNTDVAAMGSATDFSARRRRVYRSGRSGRGGKKYRRGGRSRRGGRGGGGGSRSGFLRMPSRGGMTFCLGEVRINARHLCKQTVAPIDRAAVGYQHYKNAGWTPIDHGKNWSAYPKCTVCFWGGGRQDCKNGSCGHTGLKGDGNMWVGAGVRPTPALADKNGCSRRGRRGRMLCRKPYIFHGCLIAPGFG